MPHLILHTSNRMEVLFDRLAEVVESPLSHPLEPEVIVVQSRGMERWVQMQLALRRGCWGNSVHPFPNSLVWDIFRAFIPSLPPDQAWDRESLVWRLMTLLPPLLDHDSRFLPLQRYLPQRDDLKLMQLVERIADTFDQYTIFRAEMLREWERGATDDWQAVLWRRLVAELGESHRGNLLPQFLKAATAAPPRRLPERISLFGVSYLPNFHLEVLNAVSRFVPVHLFCLNPCLEYWTEIRSRRESRRFLDAEQEGNPLLASLGRPARDFFSRIMTCDYRTEERELYVEPDGDTMLAALQRDILQLNDRRQQPAHFSPEDDSIRFHSFHTPMREVEGLHDAILHMLQTRPDLDPADIVVMTPDIDGYAPLVAAVFGGDHDRSRRIPYSIADRGGSSASSPVVAAFLAFLDAASSRFTAVDLLDLLEREPVRAKAGLQPADLGVVRRLVEQARIRWGFNEADRSRFGVPPLRQNTWEAGFDRLLLGYALPERSLYGDVLPLPVEGGDARIAGKVAEWVSAVSRQARRLTGAMTLPQWSTELLSLVDEFLEDDRSDAMESLRKTIHELTRGVDDGFTGELEASAVRRRLRQRLEEKKAGSRFLSGGVTFCEMLPMRSIPFRVVALLGMNEDLFPRRGSRPAFDLIAAEPRPGDRNQRDEDRYLFLEAVLSARDTLYVSYVGQSIRDNSTLPPSVVVSELMEYLERAFVAPDGILSHIRHVHPLQPFSRRYFTAGSGLVSYVAENCEAQNARLAGPSAAPLFAAEPLGDFPDELRTLTLRDLIAFFSNPSRQFLRIRLGMVLPEDAEQLEANEPFSLEGLDRYRLEEELLPACLEAGDAAACLPVARAEGILPPGTLGDLQFAEAAAGAFSLAERVRGHVAGGPLPPHPFRVEAGGYTLTGSIERRYGSGIVHYRPAALKGKDLLRAWLELLCLAVSGEAGTAIVLGREETVTLAAPADPVKVLADLLSFYGDGMRQPAPFFCETSYRYVAAIAEGKDEDRAFSAAMKAWRDDWRGRGDHFDPHVALCFRDDPSWDEFRQCSLRIFLPLMEGRL